MAEKRKVKDVSVDLGDITDKNVGQLKLLNRTIFPVKYHEDFYQSVLKNPNYHTKLAFYGSDSLVGAVCCRVEVAQSESKLYIMTLGVLTPYHHLGIGKQLLEHVLEEVVNKVNTGSKNKISEVYLHMQEGNNAIGFYQKYGFEVGEKVENYYLNISPAAGIILRKKLN